MPMPFDLCSSKFALRSHVPGCGSVGKKCNKNRQKVCFIEAEDAKKNIDGSKSFKPALKNSSSLKC